jgi:hypothetical protein
MRSPAPNGEFRLALGIRDSSCGSNESVVREGISDVIGSTLAVAAP